LLSSTVIDQGLFSSIIELENRVKANSYLGVILKMIWQLGIILIHQIVVALVTREWIRGMTHQVKFIFFRKIYASKHE